MKRLRGDTGDALGAGRDLLWRKDTEHLVGSLTPCTLRRLDFSLVCRVDALFLLLY